MTSYQGMFLLAAPRLQDPNFVRTVILIIRHAADGAIGLVLNRPLDTTIADAVQQVGGHCTSQSLLHHGGPCDSPLMVIHDNPTLSDIAVAEGLHVSTERAHIEPILQADAKARYFIGYAGWGEGQLEAEMETGSWFVIPADHTEVFRSSTQDQWTRLMKKTAVPGPGIDPRFIPEDPSLN